MEKRDSGTSTIKWFLIVLPIALFLGATVGNLVGGMLTDPDSGLFSSSEESEEDMVEIKWNQVQRLDMETGKVPDDFAKQLEGKVKLPGFAVQLEASFKPSKTFLFVPNQAYCVHVPPPPANLMIMVESTKVMSMEDLQGPLWLEGKLRIESTESKYGTAGWFFKADKVYEYDWEKHRGG